MQHFALIGADVAVGIRKTVFLPKLIRGGDEPPEELDTADEGRFGIRSLFRDDLVVDEHFQADLLLVCEKCYVGVPHKTQGQQSKHGASSIIWSVWSNLVSRRLSISSIALFNPPRSCPVTHMLPMLGDDWHNQYLVLDSLPTEQCGGVRTPYPRFVTALL